MRMIGSPLPPNDLVSPRRRTAALVDQGTVAWTRKDANMSHVDVARANAANPRRTMKTHPIMTLSPLLKTTLHQNRLVVP